jgi:hypothetical protein
MRTRKEALYWGKLPIGGKELDCFVLDDDKTNPTRILSTQSVFDAFERPSRGNRKQDKIDTDSGVITLPPFIASKTIFSLINSQDLHLITPIDFKDGNIIKKGYKAEILPLMCSLYLKARRDGLLKGGQQNLANISEILLESFAKVGIAALIDEATGFQTNRKSDALRQLLQVYLADGIRKWIKEFPDDFFYELDRLYGNEHLKSTQRPSYYGGFINKYVYEPIEKGKINPELQKRYKDDNKLHRKHQHFTDFGTGQLRIQIGKILGLMQVAPNLKWFKQKQERQGQLSLFPDMD